MVSTARLAEDQNLAVRISGGFRESLQKWQGWRDARWTGKLAELSGNGQFTFGLKNSVPLELAADHLSLGTASIAMAGGSININRIVWTPQTWNTKGDFRRIGLRPQASLTEGDGEGEQEGEGQQMLRLGGEWDIARPRSCRVRYVWRAKAAIGYYREIHRFPLGCKPGDVDPRRRGQGDGSIGKRRERVWVSRAQALQFR